MYPHRREHQHRKFSDAGEAAEIKATTPAPNKARSGFGGNNAMQTTVTDNGTEVPTRLNNKVFVDGLPFNFDPSKHDGRSLEDLMAQFVSDWKIGKLQYFNKKPGNGFAYISFRSPNSVEVAVNVLNGRKFLGRSLRVEVPKSATEAGAAAIEAASGSAYRQRTETAAANASRQVLITDLSKVAEPEVIRQVLRDAAPQLEAKIETIKMTSNNRKAFVTLASPDDVDAVVRFLDGYALLGRNIGATRAQMPGTLPFSKHAPVPAQAAAKLSAPPVAAAVQPSRVSFNDDDDDAIMPLGVATAPAAAAKKAVRAPAEAAASAAPATEAAAHSTTGPRDVYVVDVSIDTSEDTLRRHFSNCGVIKSAKIIVNPHTRESAGVAVVTFALPAAAKFAVNNLNGSCLGGSTIRVGFEDADLTSPSGAAITTTTAPANKKSNSDGESATLNSQEEAAFFKSRGINNAAAYFDTAPKVSLRERRDEKKQRKYDGKAEVAATPVVVAAKAKKVAAGKRERVGDDAPAASTTKAATAAPVVAAKGKALRAEATKAKPSKWAGVVDDDELYTNTAGARDGDESEEERFVDADTSAAAKGKKKAKGSGGGKKKK